MLYRTSFGSPVWRLRSPFSELERIRRQMDDLFEVYSDGPANPMGAGVFPPVNLTETADKYVVRAELPGVKNNELDINVTDKTLTHALASMFSSTGRIIRFFSNLRSQH